MSRRSHTPTIAPTGFTLIEMILVVAIVATFAAVVIPRFGNSSDHHRAELSARKLVADLAFARDAARALSSPVTFRFSTDTHRWTVSGIPPASGGVAADTFVDLSEAPFASRIESVALTIPPDQRTSSLVFSAYGIPNASARVVIRSGTVRRTVVLTSPGGAVTAE